MRKEEGSRTPAAHHQPLPGSLSKWRAASTVVDGGQLVCRGSHLGRLGNHFRAVLGTILGPSGAPWGLLGPSRGPRGALSACLGAILEISWAALGTRTPKTARTPKSSKNQKKIADSGLFGLSWRASRKPLGTFWGLLSRLEAILGRLGASWKHLGRTCKPLRPSWAVLEAILNRLGPTWSHL